MESVHNNSPLSILDLIQYRTMKLRTQKKKTLHCEIEIYILKRIKIKSLSNQQQKKSRKIKRKTERIRRKQNRDILEEGLKGFVFFNLLVCARAEAADIFLRLVLSAIYK